MITDRSGSAKDIASPFAQAPHRQSRQTRSVHRLISKRPQLTLAIFSFLVISRLRILVLRFKIHSPAASFQSISSLHLSNNPSQWRTKLLLSYALSLIHTEHSLTHLPIGH